MGRTLAWLGIAVLLAVAGPQTRSAASPAPQAQAAPLDRAERAATVAQLGEALHAMYLKPEVGQRYAFALQSNLAAGAYEDLTEPRAFGERLTKDLQSVAPDVHLRLLPNEVFEHPPEEAGGGTSRFPEGIADMRMMGRVAYLRFTAFPHDPRTAPAARAFLIAHAGDAKAVVIDARELPGGGLEVMDAMLPLFFSRPTLLMRLETRAAGDKESPFPDGPTLVRREGRPGYVTRDHVVAPDPSETRLRRTPLYYLVSGKTASAGEHLALALKRTKRATLIGETTRGAGHYVALAPVGTSLTALIPVGRSFDPDTGWDWDGKGVAPDVAVPADDALQAALSRIG
ncbi:MAG TPA: S41 family peptidase [Allosphingosinicella sp.]|jgi:hypothetical protein